MYSNMKITAHMRTPISTMDPIMLDSVLIAAYMKDRLKDGYYGGENVYDEENVVIEYLSELMDRKYGVFCASQGFGEHREFISSWVKRFDTTDVDLIKFSGKGKVRLDVCAGPHKNYHMPMVAQSYKSIIFYVRGNREKIEKLLTTYISYLGKKGSQGFGQILRWEFEDMEEDYSIYKDGELMRPIPIKQCRTEKYGTKLMPLTPPYWRREKELCAVPIM